MPDLSREERINNFREAVAAGRKRYMPGTPEKYPLAAMSVPILDAEAVLDALDAVEQRAKGAALESDERAEKWRAAEQRAEKAERDLALEMDSRGRWAARAEDAEQRVEEAEAEAKRLRYIIRDLDAVRVAAEYALERRNMMGKWTNEEVRLRDALAALKAVDNA